jgi:ribose 5-phosphate isomerase B
MAFQRGHTVLDCGTMSLDSVDYPDYVHDACNLLTIGYVDRAVVVCGSGERFTSSQIMN